MAPNFQGIMGSKITYLNSAQKRLQAKIPLVIAISLDELGPGEYLGKYRVLGVGFRGSDSTGDHCKVCGSVRGQLTLFQELLRVLNRRAPQEGLNVPVMSTS